MAYELLILYGILSITIGIVPSIGFAIWQFGFKKRLWYSWLLGGLFWALALIVRSIPLFFLILIMNTPHYIILISVVFAGIFETAFRVLLLLVFTKNTANTKEKVIMAGLGWGTFEAIISHTIPLILLLLFLRNSNYLEGIEFSLLFGGYQRIITEIFHLNMMIVVFYGTKHKLKGIKESKPIEKNFFSKDPNPVWNWILIAAFLHFSYDYLSVIFWIWIGLILSYVMMTVFVIILTLYTIKRIDAYPLFQESY